MKSSRQGNIGGRGSRGARLVLGDIVFWIIVAAAVILVLKNNGFIGHSDIPQYPY